MISLPVEDLFLNLDFLNPEFPTIIVKGKTITVDDKNYQIKDASEKTISTWLNINLGIPFNLFKIYKFTKKIIIK